MSEVRALHERYNPWTGRATLLVEGPAWRVPLRPGYGRTRALLRRWLPDVPFSSDWMDGRFPGAPAGLPPSLVLALGAGVAAVVAVVLGIQLGWVAGGVAALVAAWPIGRLRDAWEVRAEGLRGGPPWAPTVPWYDLDEVRIIQGRRRTWVFTRGRGGGQAAALPTALVPAFRARVRRLGGLEIVASTPDVEDRYLRWRAPALGVPWGIGLGAVAVAWFTPAPWTALTAGAAAMAGTALLGAMVSLRAGGWGVGSVLAGTALYGLLLLVFGVGWGGWLGGS
jgi:hypothetical protein